ncbi:MAG TPA: nucleotide sugar dehydrogenase [Tepidisphaeraceae bacterium]|nr:nucleotide sugar dehydrogenase [Tepidisphaeraceae bacterium]
MIREGSFNRDVCVIGGGGHVGLPLAITFAQTGLKTVIYDINPKVVESIRSGIMPFIEEGGQEALGEVIKSGKLEAYSTPEHVIDCRFVVLIVGTPVDEHLNPNFIAIHKALELCLPNLRSGQILILRSTVFPGITRHIQNFLANHGLDIAVSFCPERAVQGYSLREFRENPQMISATDAKTLAEVRQLFSGFVTDFIEMDPMEAELAKLMTNAWRYIQFATVNQFFMIATQHGLDFNRILKGCRDKYPRMAGMPGPGFAAGPCLVKDTMQLAAFSQNNFVLGHAAMLINEGLPLHVVQMAKQMTDISRMTAGILGMAFKAESDDHRDSLAYKLRKLLTLETKKVICTDPYVKDKSFLPQDQVLKEADILFVSTPHKAYRGLKIPAAKYVVDVWNCVDASQARTWQAEHQAHRR